MRSEKLTSIVFWLVFTTSILVVSGETVDEDDELNSRLPKPIKTNLRDEKSAGDSKSEPTFQEIAKNGAIENNLSRKKLGKVSFMKRSEEVIRLANSRSGNNDDEDPSGKFNADLEPKEEDFIQAADHGINAMNDLFSHLEPKLYSLGLYLEPNHPAKFVAAFNSQTEEAKYLAKYGYATIEGSKKFLSKYPISMRNTPTVVGATKATLLSQQCPKKGIPQCPPASLRFRTADGSCNNLRELWWGSAMSVMQRFLPPAYNDGIQSVRKSVTGRHLPSAREITDLIHEDKDAPLSSVTHMLMQWGQFVDHDITATAQSRAFNGSVPRCCLQKNSGFQPSELMHPECLPIAVSPTDRFFGRLGVRCLEFIRSAPAPKEDCEFGSREQLNQVTSYLDASTVYSSSARQSDGLRIFRNGLLQYGRIQTRKPLLPKENSDLCRQGSVSTSCFRAGDGRLSEQPALISLHVVFLRLHNRLATQMSALNKLWSDERIFQETRKIVGALVQQITYREFLPIVVGPDVMKIFDLELLKKDYYQGYDPTVNPNIANDFAGAAFRFGHSLVQPSFIRFNRVHQSLADNVSIHEEFSNPANLETSGSIDRILLGLVNQPAQKRDEFITKELTNHLFQTPGFLFGMDLASINIQRGRDHGIPSYISYRVPCGLKPINDWADMEKVTSPEAVRKFRELYDKVDDVDLFPAGLAEKPVVGGLVGPTFACIVAQQFRNLRRGDRFWYENPFVENAFTPEQLQQIRKVTLAQILCRTMDNIDNIQPFVMLAVDGMKNQRLPCTDPLFQNINLEAWIDKNLTKRDTQAAKKDNFESVRDVKLGEEIKEEIESRTSSTKNHPSSSHAKPADTSKFSPVRKPIKNKINQHNVVNVRKPIGQPDNVTIVINNHAVNSPVFVSDSVYGSNFQLGNPDTVTPNLLPQGGSTSTTTATPIKLGVPVKIPLHPNVSQLVAPYFPHNFQDPNNPTPPNYGFSPTPINNYFPSNEFFARNKPSAPLPVSIANSTNTVKSSNHSSGLTDIFKNLEPNKSDRDNHNMHLTKRPPLSTPNTRYPVRHPPNVAYISDNSGYSVRTDPHKQTSNWKNNTSFFTVQSYSNSETLRTATKNATKPPGNFEKISTQGSSKITFNYENQNTTQGTFNKKTYQNQPFPSDIRESFEKTKLNSEVPKPLDDLKKQTEANRSTIYVKRKPSPPPPTSSPPNKTQPIVNNTSIGTSKTLPKEKTSERKKDNVTIVTLIPLKQVEKPPTPSVIFHQKSNTVANFRNSPQNRNLTSRPGSIK